MLCLSMWKMQQHQRERAMYFYRCVTGAVIESDQGEQCFTHSCIPLVDFWPFVVTIGRRKIDRTDVSKRVHCCNKDMICVAIMCHSVYVIHDEMGYSHCIEWIIQQWVKH